MAVIVIAWLELIPGFKLPFLHGEEKQGSQGELELSGLRSSAAEVAAGEMVTITADAKNVGNARGEFKLTMRVEEPDNSWSTQTKVIWLAPGEVKRVTFDVRIEKHGKHIIKFPGGYETDVRGREPTTGMLKVVGFVDLPSEVEAGAEVKIVVEVQNVGDLKVTKALTLRVDGNVVDSEFPTLAPKETKREVFSWVPPPEAGEYELEVGGESKTVEVTGKAIFVLEGGLEIQPLQARVEEKISIDARVKNKGNITGSHRVTLKVNFREQESKMVELPPGQMQSVAFTFSTSEPGTYTLEAEGTSRDVKVLKPGELKVEELTAPDSGVVLEEIEVRVAVSNEGEVEDNFTVVLDIGGDAGRGQGLRQHRPQIHRL